MKPHRWQERPDDAGKMTRKDICADCGAVRVRRWRPGDGERYRVVGYALHAKAVMVATPPMCKEGDEAQG